MKKLLMIMLVGFVAIGTYSQNTERSSQTDEMVPAQLKTNEMQQLAEINVKPTTQLCAFMQNEMEYPEFSAATYQEGEVVVQFTIEEDGNIRDIEIINSVSREIDQAVIDCLTKTNGQWEAAVLDGRAIETEKRLYVIFDLAGNQPHAVQANELFEAGIKAFKRAESADTDYFSNKDARDRKSERLYNQALALFEKATKFKAEEPSIIFWEAKVYEKMGDMSMMQDKLEEYNQLISPDQSLNKEFVTIGINSKD